MPEPIFMKPGKYIMPSEAIKTVKYKKDVPVTGREDP
jgi:hypothetical protein